MLERLCRARVSESLPLCFDFMADGRPILVSNQHAALLTLEDDGSLAHYADLSALSPFGCNDIVVAGWGKRVRQQRQLRLRGGAARRPGAGIDGSNTRQTYRSVDQHRVDLLVGDAALAHVRLHVIRDVQIVPECR